MKIYNEVRIDIDTGETTHEDAFEYEGEVAQCFGSSTPPGVDYSQSPEQRQMYSTIMPLIRSMSARAMNSNQLYSPRQQVTPNRGMMQAPFMQGAPGPLAPGMPQGGVPNRPAPGTLIDPGGMPPSRILQRPGQPGAGQQAMPGGAQNQQAALMQILQMMQGRR